MNTHNDLAYWLATTYLYGVGPIQMRRWLEHIGDIKSLFLASAKELRLIGLNEKHIVAIKNPNWKAVEADLTWAETHNAAIITQADPLYPPLLREAAGSPLLLYVQGDATLLSSPQLAMVGSRNPSITGIETAKQFAHCLAKAGLVITSGLAFGIDAASHRGALMLPKKTIAVVGTGLNTVYPAAHRQLAEEIKATGALVSEFSPNTPAKAKHFPLRNRIISGMSLGVLVIEAALKSGSLITARYAIEQNRDVFAIPGSIHHPLARGCHYLIQQGAKLVETAADILQELQILQEVNEKITRQSDIPLLKFIGWETTPVDTIIARSGLTPAEVSSMLLSLELEGYVQVKSGGYMRSTK